jgi:RND superfamily putative drug exporter
MKRLGIAVTSHSWRVLTVWVVAIVALLALTSPGGVATREDVMKSDPAAFLSQQYESARAARLEQRGFPTPDGATAVLVVRRADHRPLTAADVRQTRSLATRVSHTDGVRALQVSPSGLSENRKVLLGDVLFDHPIFSQKIKADVDALRDGTTPLFQRAGLVAGYAGDAPATADAQDREGATSALTMVVIAVLLMVLFRSVVVAFFDVVLIAIVGAMATAMLVLAAKAFGFPLSQDVTGLLPIVVLGVGTDYVIFLLHRYREHLREGEAPRQAMSHAIRRIGPAIGYSALTVTVALSALALSSMESFKVLGPALGFSVLATLAAALTLVPAAAVLMRRGLFWPHRRQLDRTEIPKSTRTERFVSGKPIAAAIAAGAILIALAVPALGFTPDYNSDSSVPGSASEKAYADLKTGFPQGALEPTSTIIHVDGAGRLTTADVAPVTAALRQTDGVGEVLPPVVSRDGRTAKVDALLDDKPFTSAALNTVEDRVRPAVAAAAGDRTTVAVGGNTSAYADYRVAISKDQKLIFPVAALLVAAILAMLLRSVTVPLIVMGGVTLGFVATLGASVVAFQAIGGADGLTFQLPLIVYLFVASMTSDYAILILARVREEIAGGRTPRDAAAIALRTAGPSVLHAGLVLAASFAVLIISPSLGQIGFAIATGILLSSLLTARILIPALTVLIGRTAWWPSRLAHRRTRRPSAAPAPELAK